jgi:surface-anchored protein
MSSGISKSLSQKIDIKSNVDSEITIAVGDPAPIDSQPFTVYENGVDVTASATITHSVSGPDGSTDFSKPGTYTITYKVKYDGESSTATTRVYVEGDEPEDPEDPDTP